MTDQTRWGIDLVQTKNKAINEQKYGEKKAKGVVL